MGFVRPNVVGRIATFLTRLSIKNEGTPNMAIAAQETVTVEMIANPMAFH
jgi:hypothetical protein